MDVASMTLRVTFGIVSVCTRSTALSSISWERSIPVSRTAGGERGRVRPVPMPPPSTRSFGSSLSCLTAGAPPGGERSGERRGGGEGRDPGGPGHLKKKKESQKAVQL